MSPTLPITGPFVGGFAMAIDKLHGIAVCNASLPNIAVTTDGCQTFTSVSVGAGFTSTNFVKAEWVANTSQIYIFGDGVGNTTGACKRSTDGGTTWTTMTTLGLVGFSDMSYVVVGNTVFAYAVSASDGSVIKLSADPIITGISNNNNNVPKEFKLEQNYPNPFNPSTKINYSLPKAADVSIKIFDMLGHEVMSVVNEHKEAGSYSATVDASTLSSGVYFYTLKAGDFRDSKKMTLVK
jgi:hypothetical protein